MIKQIKYVLWKFLFAAAIVAVFSGFTTLADDELPDEPPVYRCPKKSFLLRTGCHQVKPIKPEIEVSKPQKPDGIFNLNSGLSSATGALREIFDGKIYEKRKL